MQSGHLSTLSIVFHLIILIIFFSVHIVSRVINGG